jgi:cyanase
MKRGAYLINTARGKICDRDAVVRALESGQLAGYAGDALGLSEEAIAILQEIPMRGSFATLPPTDPTIHRLYEVLRVYGPALKALIHEDFGDGIMSAINFNLALERGEPGPRVQITMNDKWLPYQWQPERHGDRHGRLRLARGRPQPAGGVMANA